MLVTLIYIPIITLMIMNINLLIFKNVELYKSFKFIEVSFDKIIKIINILSINITLSYSLYIWRYCQILKNMIFIIKYITNYYKNITLLISNKVVIVELLLSEFIRKRNINWLYFYSAIKLNNIGRRIAYMYTSIYIRKIKWFTIIAKPWIFILFTFIISIHWLIKIGNAYIWICGIAFIISLIYFGISNLYDVFMNFIKFDIYNFNAIYSNWIYFIYIFILNYKI